MINKVVISAFVTIFLTVASANSGLTGSFVDVSESHSAAQAIVYLQTKAVMNGYADNTFRPEQELNRAEVAMVAYRLKGEQSKQKPSVTAKCFTDVALNLWYTDAICWAKQQKIVSGFPDGRFYPNQKVKLAEAAKIIVNISGQGPSQTVQTQSSVWYEPYITVLSENNYLPQTLTSVGDNVTRAELAEILWRTLEHHALAVAFHPLIKASPAKTQTEVRLNVPFTSQAPLGNWSPPYDEACEEASLLMVNAYLSNAPLNADAANQNLLALLQWIQSKGYQVDIGVDESKTIVEAYYPDRKAEIYSDSEVTAEKIKSLLAAGHPVIIPVAGQMLGNPYYKSPGPPYHMLVIIGYNDTNFITNDPGTSHGAGYQYKIETIMNAIHDWTGGKSTAASGQKAIIVIMQRL